MKIAIAIQVQVEVIERKSLPVTFEHGGLKYYLKYPIAHYSLVAARCIEQGERVFIMHVPNAGQVQYYVFSTKKSDE